jgi:thiamine pyrophosphate-dependent acetolactate synthase large subunit-like protein
MGKGTVAGGTELYMGTAALSERDYVHEAIEQADLTITIGHDTIEKPPSWARVAHMSSMWDTRRRPWSRSISRNPR